MRNLIGYTLITAAFAGFIVWLFVSCFLAIDELKLVFGLGALGLLIAGCSLCADEFFGIPFPQKRKRR